MDLQRDFPRFRKLMARLCETLGKPLTDELVESWWKALRFSGYEGVERKVENFIAKADETTRFPRPGQMRPEDSAAPIQVEGDPVRDYWRSSLVAEVCRVKAITPDKLLEELDVDWSLSAALRQTLDQLCAQEREGGRTAAVHRWCNAQAALVAKRA